MVAFAAVMLANAAVPVKVGDAENTTLPDPVSSVRSAASSAEVSMDVLETLLLKMVQSVDARYPFCPAVPTWMASVLPEKVNGEEMVVGITEPFALVERSVEGRLEMAKDVEVAAWRVEEPVRSRLVKKPVPETVRAVVDAYGKVEAPSVEVAVNILPVTWPANTPSPVTLSVVPGVVVPPMPTNPPVEESKMFP